MKARRAASIALAVSLLVGTAGCTLASDSVDLKYAPSDGTAADIGELHLLNVIGLSENGDDVSLLMTIVNDADEDVEVNLQFTDESGEKDTLTVTVRANSSEQFGGSGDEEVVARNVGAAVGGLLPVYVQYGDEPGKQLQVPVLDGAIAEYADLLPEPEPEPTVEPTPTETPAA